jgi:hypothetical protein
VFAAAAYGSQRPAGGWLELGGLMIDGWWLVLSFEVIMSVYRLSAVRLLAVGFSTAEFSTFAVVAVVGKSPILLNCP